MRILLGNKYDANYVIATSSGIYSAYGHEKVYVIGLVIARS